LFIPYQKIGDFCLPFLASPIRNKLISIVNNQFINNTSYGQERQNHRNRRHFLPMRSPNKNKGMVC
jgi:hypothetical protein